VKELAVKSAYAADPPASLHEFDFDKNTGYETATPTDVEFYLYLDIGRVDADWTEHFRVLVCTPNNRPRNDPSARFLLLPEYSFNALKQLILATLKSCERSTWEECLEALRERFRWEWD
jgi:hypothetical protein